VVNNLRIAYILLCYGSLQRFKKTSVLSMKAQDIIKHFRFLLFVGVRLSAFGFFLTAEHL